jgi:hypothetical protein
MLYLYMYSSQPEPWTKNIGSNCNSLCTLLNGHSPPSENTTLKADSGMSTCKNVMFDYGVCLSLYKIIRVCLKLLKLRFGVYPSTTLVAIFRINGCLRVINHISPTSSLFH